MKWLINRRGGSNRLWSLALTLVLSVVSASVSAAGDRIVALTANWAHTVAEIGALDELVGVTRYAIYPAQIPKRVAAGTLPVVGGYVDINLEKVQALSPTLVLTATDLQKPLASQLRQAGYQVVHMESASLGQVYEAIAELGAALDRMGEARALNQQIQTSLARLSAMVPTAQRPRVYYELNYYYKCAPGQDSYITDLIRLAGGQPLFGDRAGAAPAVSWPEVVSADPEVILIPDWPGAGGPHFSGPETGNGTTTVAEVSQRENASKVSAITQHSVRFIDSAVTKQPGPLLPLALQAFIEQIHGIELPTEVPPSKSSVNSVTEQKTL
ncbi:ABC transporter substrate-binding protein [Ferrimonas balearica]|uniref:ABC transporter substrate-binding protein n=1 Tax=Ferrimonas balearica TaxID=44012 RepID=UPI001C93DD89|nr:helical backbone metal receptor [Ferrimonas balearica]MBY6226165.1 helical backbone metal receptor [Ferrimonas balearica]